MNNNNENFDYKQLKLGPSTFLIENYDVCKVEDFKKEFYQHFDLTRDTKTIKIEAKDIRFIIK